MLIQKADLTYFVGGRFKVDVSPLTGQRTFHSHEEEAIFFFVVMVMWFFGDHFSDLIVVTWMREIKYTVTDQLHLINTEVMRI